MFELRTAELGPSYDFTGHMTWRFEAEAGIF